MVFPTIGTTVSVRARTPVGPVTVVGVVVAADNASWALRRRDGSVFVVAVGDIDASRVVPPPRSARVSVADLERVAALGWRARETSALGTWLLRAGGGITSRANSALAPEPPGMDLTTALGAVQDWYAARKQQAYLQVPLVAGQPPFDLSTSGWQLTRAHHVMTAEVAHVLRAAERIGANAKVQLSDEPDEEWVAFDAGFHDSKPDPDRRRLLTDHEQLIFAQIRGVEDERGKPAAIARIALDGRWAGIFCVAVAPDRRREGLATALVGSALREAGHRGARQAYLQLGGDNATARIFWERLNFTTHHDYAFATPSGAH